MRFVSALVFTLLIAAQSAPAQEWAQRRLESSLLKHEWAGIPRSGRDIQAFISSPKSDQKVTTVIFLHGDLGLTDWIRSLTDKVAESGYIGIAPDLLSGMSPNGGGTRNFFVENDIRRALFGLEDEAVFADIDSVVQFALKHPKSNGKVVIFGASWGGTKAFKYAIGRKHIQSVFVFYGMCPTDEKQLAKLEVPVHGYFGILDHDVYATVPRCAELSRFLKKSFTPTTYDGLGTNFLQEGDAPDAKPLAKKARDDAWKSFVTTLKSI